MRQIVITGAEGFIGRHLVACFADKGWPVLAVDCVERQENIKSGVTYHKADLSDPETMLPSGCSLTDNTWLIHLAWDLNRESATYQIQSTQVSILAGLLEYWQDRGLCRVIAMGSAEEYGDRSGIIAESDKPAGALSPYGWAKYAAFMMSSSWAIRNKCQLCWLRPFVVYGPGQHGDMLIPYAVNQAINKLPAMFTNGEQSRDFIFIDDLVDAIVMAVDSSWQGAEAINIASGKAIKVRQILQEIARFTDAKDLFDIGGRPRRIGEPELQQADISQAKNLLNWAPVTDWKEGLQRTCR